MDGAAVVLEAALSTALARRTKSAGANAASGMIRIRVFSFICIAALSAHFAACGGVLTDDSGTISPPTSRDEYHHNTNCTWVITARENRVVQLKYVVSVCLYHMCQ